MNSKLFFLLFAFNSIAGMDNFHKALKTSSEMVKSLCGVLHTDHTYNAGNVVPDHIFSKNEQALLNPYLGCIEKNANSEESQLEKEIIKLLNRENVENLNSITRLADYLGIPILLQLCINLYTKKLLTATQLDEFEKNPNNYLDTLNLPETISTMIAPQFMEKNPPTNYFLMQTLKKTPKPLFSRAPDQSKKYVLNNAETICAIRNENRIQFIDIINNDTSSFATLSHSSFEPCIFSKQDSYLICSADDELCIINCKNKNAWPTEINYALSIFDTSNDEQLLAAKSQTSGYLYLFNTSDGSLIRTHEIPNNVAITSIKIHPDNQLIISGHANGAIHLWKKENCKPHSFTNHTGAINDIDFNHDGSLLVTGGQDQAICVWNFETGTLKHRFTNSAPIKTITFHPNKNLLATLNQSSTASIYDLETMKKLMRVKPKQTARNLSGSPQIRWSKNGEQLICIHKTLHTHMISVQNNDQCHTDIIFSGLPIDEKCNSSPDMRLSRHGSYAMIYQKEKKPTHMLIDLAKIPQMRKEITRSATLPQALGLAVWHKNPQIFNQRSEMRALIENADDLIKKNLGLIEQ